MKKVCASPGCSREFEAKGNAKTCSRECGAVYIASNNRIRSRKWYRSQDKSSAEWKAKQKVRNSSPRAKAARHKYKSSPKGRAAIDKYNESPKGKTTRIAAAKKWRIENIDRVREYARIRMAERYATDSAFREKKLNRARKEKNDLRRLKNGFRNFKLSMPLTILTEIRNEQHARPE